MLFCYYSRRRRQQQLRSSPTLSALSPADIIGISNGTNIYRLFFYQIPLQLPASWVKKEVEGRKLCNFQQTLQIFDRIPTDSCNVPTILILAINFHKMGVFISKFCIFRHRQKIYCGQLPPLITPHATTLLILILRFILYLLHNTPCSRSAEISATGRRITTFTGKWIYANGIKWSSKTIQWTDRNP